MMNRKQFVFDSSFIIIAFGSLVEPRLTTVCLPRGELGRHAVEALIATISHPEQQGVEIKIPTYLVARGSTAPARAAGETLEA